MDLSVPSGSSSGALGRPLDRRRLAEAFFANLKPETRRAYLAELARFAAWCGVGDLDRLADRLFGAGQGAGNELALGWRGYLLERTSQKTGRKLSPATIARSLAAIKSFAKLARTIGVVSWVLEVPSVRVEPYQDVVGPSQEEVLGMLAGIEKLEPPVLERDRALSRLLLRGLRRHEVSSLDLEHFDLQAGRLSILGKGRLAREWHRLSEKTLGVTQGWVAARESWLEYHEIANPALFLGLEGPKLGGRLSMNAIWDRVKRWAQLGGVELSSRIRPHGFRHYGITRVLERTSDFRVAQAFSRHKDPRILYRYDDAIRKLDKKGAEIVDEEV